MFNLGLLKSNQHFKIIINVYVYVQSYLDLCITIKKYSHRPEFYYSCGRTSQIWRVNSKAMLAYPSDRVSVLARHKTAPSGYLEHRPQFVYSCGRSSPIWQPRTRSMSCPERPRTASLARPKQTHMDYKPNRQVRRLILVETA